MEKDALKRTKKLLIHDIDNINKGVKINQFRIEEANNNNNAIIKKNIDKFNELIKIKTEELENLKSSYELRFEEKIDDFKKIYNIVADRALSENYGREAKKFRFEKNIWRLLTVIALLLFIMFTIDIFINYQGESKDVYSLVSKFLVTIPVATLFTYFSKQASRCEKYENQFLLTELELNTLNGYLEPLNSEKQAYVREKLVDAYFGNANVREESELNYFKETVEIYKELVFKLTEKDKK